MDELHCGHGPEIKWALYLAIRGPQFFIAIFLLAISEAFFRKTGMWPKMSLPTSPYRTPHDDSNDYGKKCSVIVPRDADKTF